MLTNLFYILWCLLIITYAILIGQVVWASKKHKEIGKFILPWITISASLIFPAHIFVVGLSALDAKAILYGVLLILLSLALPFAITLITHYRLCVKKKKLNKREFGIVIIDGFVMLALYILQVNLV